MNLLMIGAGYVGLVSAACFAEMGHHVLCLDINTSKIEDLKRGVIPIYEPGLKEIIERNMKAKRLTFTTDYSTSLHKIDACFIAVDTPAAKNGEADTTHVQEAAKMLGRHLEQNCVIVTKSTVPVGTTALVEQIIQRELIHRHAGFDFTVASNPEFLKEGHAIRDCLKPDRVVMGANHPRAASVLKQIYSPLSLNENQLHLMDIHSAEISKYVFNAMLATRISFMNEIASLCEKLGADISAVRNAVGADQRIGNQYLDPGAGFGGSCLPKDIKALIAQAKCCGMNLSILEAVEKVNENQKELMASKLADYFASRGGLPGKTVGILGLSFKPDTDDLREAPSLVLIKSLLGQSVSLRLFDPVAMPAAAILLKDGTGITWCQSEAEAARGADALVLMTEWKQFRSLDFNLLLNQMNGNAFFDGRNQYRPKQMAQKGFDYISIGHVPVYASQ